jgi:hypothetical protein
MNKAELPAATRRFDRDFIADEARPMTAAERAEDKRARRRATTPIGNRTRSPTKNSVSIDNSRQRSGLR